MKPLKLPILVACVLVIGSALFALEPQGELEVRISPTGLVIHPDGTVSDQQTQLMWERLPKVSDHQKFGHEAAVLECQHRRTAGYSDWRLPSKEELATIITTEDSRKTGDLYADTAAFPNMPRYPYYWSSTVYADNTYHAWYGHFTRGRLSHCSRPYRAYVRCVR